MQLRSSERTARALAIAGAVMFACVGGLAAPQSAKSANEFGKRLFAQGRYSEALAKFRAAEKLNGRDLNIQYNLGLTLVRMGRFHAALAPLRAAAADPSLSDGARYLRGVALFQTSALADCVREVEPLRTHGTFGEQVLYMLVEGHRRLGNAEQSRRAFEELVQSNADSAFVHKLLGIAYDAEHRWPEARDEFQAALRAQPDMPEIRFAIGYLHWKQMELQQAREWFEKELSIQPCYATAHYYLGEVERTQDQPAAAAAHYRRAIACDADHVDAYLRLGTVLGEQGQTKEALQVTREYIRRRAGSAAGYYRLGLLLRGAGREAEASAAFKKVAELNAAANQKTIEWFERARDNRPLSSILR